MKFKGYFKTNLVISLKRLLNNIDFTLIKHNLNKSNTHFNNSKRKQESITSNI